MTGEIVIHGLGYVGLTAAVHYAKAGWKVIGYDPDPATVASINEGHPRAGEFLSYLDADVQSLVSRGEIKATREFSHVQDYSIHSIAVPTERNGEPYDGIVLNVLDRLGRSAPDGATILIESTLTPGTIDRAFAESPELARRTYGHHIALAVCPRRDWFADKEKNLATLPRVVGGVTSTCTEAAMAILSSVSKTLLPTTYKTAELTKALENALLHVPVMFAHQLAVALPHLDVAEALRLAGTHWRLTPLYLGFGSGGRCVPLGTQYLAMAAAQFCTAANPSVLQMAEEALHWDGQMRMTICEIVRKAKPESVLVLGMAYRPDFRDMGLSPGLAVARHLKRMSVAVTVHDPMWSEGELFKLTKLPVLRSTIAPHLTKYGAILLATPHTAYRDLPLDPEQWKTGQIVLDAQSAWRGHRERFKQHGVTYKCVGEPGWMTLKEGF